MRGVREKMNDVSRILAAARVLQQDSGLMEKLVLSTGLSMENVQKGLAEHLEVDATEAELERFVLRFGDASRITVILAANVFVAALRAICCARAKGERVTVRPSSREPELAAALVSQIADPAIELATSVDVKNLREGEIHVYGKDETIAKFKKAAHVPVIGHGHGLGVSWLTTATSVSDAIAALESDIVAFDQRGCLSLRILFVEGGPTRAEEVGRALHRALNTTKIPRGTLTREERAESVRFSDTMTMVGEVLSGHAHVVAIAPSDAPTIVPPTGRHVVVRHALRDAELTTALSPIAKWVCAFGTDDPARAKALAPPHSRISLLGHMQKPRLDGYVDLRVT
jgi:hypothetical protein